MKSDSIVDNLILVLVCIALTAQAVGLLLAALDARRAARARLVVPFPAAPDHAGAARLAAALRRALP